jgi:xylulokinase
LRDAGRLVETHAYPGGAYFIENPGWLSGGALSWLASLLQISDFAAMDAQAGEVAPGADGVRFIPALTGAMAPEWLPEARGCFYGLTPAHGRSHLIRAVLEGCRFAMRDVIDHLAEMGVETRSLLLLGGGARSRLWAQMRADIAGRPEIPAASTARRWVWLCWPPSPAAGRGLATAAACSAPMRAASSPTAARARPGPPMAITAASSPA